MPRFLSTLSLRRATVMLRFFMVIAPYFYPRSPCGERHHIPKADGRPAAISIHALLAESDGLPDSVRPLSIAFLSTLSLRRATVQGPCVQVLFHISIHALLAESDLMWYQCNTVVKEFLSTLSLRRATQSSRTGIRKQVISIHALLAESDLFLRFGPMTRPYFYPRSPCGERPPRLSRVVPTPIFLSTLSLRRATNPSKLA